jgi:hypothetical protein
VLLYPPPKHVEPAPENSSRAVCTVLCRGTVHWNQQSYPAELGLRGLLRAWVHWGFLVVTPRGWGGWLGD